MSDQLRRAPGILHRSAVAAVDVLASPTVGVATAITEGGSTLANSNMKYTVAAGNRWGATTVAAVQNLTPTLNQAIRIPITQVVGAEWYDIFLSTAAAPLWVGRITETQRAAGGFIISAVGTVTAGGGAGAGAVDIGIQGTGLASNVNPFAVNNAYTPTVPTPVVCTGYRRAYLHIKVAVTDLRSLPTLTLSVYLQNQASSGDWHLLSQPTINLLAAVGQPLSQVLALDVDGAAGLVVLVQAISGQGTAVSVWVELLN